MLKYILQLHYCLEHWEHGAVEELLAMPAMHADETSLRVEKKNYWIHVYSAGDITLKFLHPKRGGEAIEAIGIIPRYGGVVIHDCWASYLAYDHCGHGLCGSHLLRELTFIVDANGYAWAANMKRLLQENCVIVAKRKNKKLTPGEYKNLQKRYRNILTRGEKELPPIPPRQNGKRGRIAKSDAHNLWERLKRHETAVLLFAKLSHVAFTNNRAERDLRMSKVKQKVSGCFRKQTFAHAYCRISSYLQTMANKGYNPLVAIQMALSGQSILKGESSYLIFLQSVYNYIKHEVVGVKIELEIPDEEGNYPTEIINYIEHITTPQKSDFKRYFNFHKTEVPEYELSLKQVQEDFDIFIGKLTKLPRITRDFFSFLIERRDSEKDDGYMGAYGIFYYDKLVRICHYPNFEGDIRILTESGFISLQDPDEMNENGYLQLRARVHHSKHFFYELTEFIEKKSIGYQKPIDIWILAPFNQLIIFLFKKRDYLLSRSSYSQG